jgi:hypothetical protein
MNGGTMTGINRRTVFLILVTLVSLGSNYLILNGYSLHYVQIDVTKLAENLSDQTKGWWLYTILLRVKQFVFLWLLVKLLPYSVIQNLFLVMTAVCAGLLFSVETFYYGVSGILITGLCFLPHYVFYFLSIKMLAEYYNDITKKKSAIPRLLMILLIFCFGVLSELTWNQFFLKKIFLDLVV